jgi:thiamine kinase-like enzyme
MSGGRDPLVRAATLTCWSAPVEPEPLEGGITNVNFVVRDRGARYFVRIGHDIPIHGIMRFHEVAAARAASAVGLSPEVIHAEPGVMVTRFIQGRSWKPEDLRTPANLERMVDLVRRCHRELPRLLHGPAMMFWVFHVIRGYGATLRDGNSRCAALLPDLLARADMLEQAVGPIEVVFGHNDLLAANFIDDGKRLWLVDWEYAGFNSPLFDLANVASNNEFSAALEDDLLAAYYRGPANDELRRGYQAMKCASLLRETMWSMVSEIHSKVEFDYVAYTEENLARFERAYAQFA